MKGRTYGNLFLHATGQYWYMADTEPHINIKLKSIFPKIAKMCMPPFEFENTKENCADLYWFSQRYALRITDDDEQALVAGKDRFYQNQLAMEAILCPDYTPPLYALREGQGIRQYQAQAIQVLDANGVLLCGDEVGLGKTYVGIGACLDPKHLPAAIVVQSHLPRQWAEKIAEFSHLKVHIIKKTRAYPLPPADVYIFRYTCLAGWIEVFTKGFFKIAVFDEIQELRCGTSTAKGQGASYLCQHTKWNLGLTATPVYNYGNEMWNIFNILKNHCLGSYDDFLREWGAQNGYGASKIEIKDPKALGSYLREQYLFLRRTREDVGRELPPVNRIIETVGYDEGVVKSAEELARQLAVRASSGTFMERGQAARELDMMVRQMTGVSKARHVAEFVKILLDNGEPVVLAGWHREVYAIWQKELAEYKPVMYTGSESPAQKKAAEQAFISGESNLFIISLRSGVGLDGLQARGSIMVIGELDWSPMVHHQLIGRLDREGQTKQVMAIFLVSDSGSDPLLIDLLGLKASQAQGIVDPHLGVQQVHSDQTRLQMLVKKYLKGRAHVEDAVIIGGGNGEAGNTEGSRQKGDGTSTGRVRQIGKRGEHPPEQLSLLTEGRQRGPYYTEGDGGSHLPPEP